MRHRIRSRLLWLVLPAVFLTCIPTDAARATASRAGTTAAGIHGKTTTWNVALAGVRSLPHILHTTWVDPTHHWSFYVAMVRLTNSGTRAAVPADDLLLTMKVIPPHPTRYLAGWASLPRQKPYDAWTRTAMQQFGGAPPWIAAQPGQSATYCYVFMTARGDSHYGLYNVWLAPGGSQHTAINLPHYTFLLAMGL